MLEIFGWGSQNIDDVQEKSEYLAALTVNVISCALHLPVDVNRTWLGSLQGRLVEQNVLPFICIRAPRSAGGPCNGDDGGEGSEL